MAETLKDLQKKIYKRNEKELKLRAEESELILKLEQAKKENKKEKDLETLKEKIQLKEYDISQNSDKRGFIENKISSRLEALENHINYNTKSQVKINRLLNEKIQSLRDQQNDKPEIKNKLLKAEKEAQEFAQDEIKKVQSEVKKAQKEIEEYQLYLAETQEKFEATLKKEKERQEKKYSEEKKKILESLTDIIHDPKGLQEILKPLASKDLKKNEGIGFVDKAKAAVEVVSFAASHAGSIARIIGSRNFYSAEAKKLVNIVDKKEQYNSSNPPFFVKLLHDPEMLNFLANQGPAILNLVQVVSPLLAPIILKELGKIDVIEKELKDKAKDFEVLPSKKAELSKLKLDSATKGGKRSKELRQEIAVLKDLQDRAEIARAIHKLKLQGLGDEFINQHLLPIVIDTFKTLLASPQDLIEVAKAGVDYAIAPNDRDKAVARETILGKIDFKKLLLNPKIISIFNEQNVALTEMVSTAMNLGSANIEAELGKLGVSREDSIKLLKSIDPKQIQVLMPLVINLADGLGEDLSKEDIKAIFENLKILAPLPEEKDHSQSVSSPEIKIDNAKDLSLKKIPGPLDKKIKADAQAKLLSILLKMLSSEKMNGAIGGLSKFLSEDANVSTINIIASSILKNSPILKGFGLDEKLIETTVPLVAAIVSKSLTDSAAVVSLVKAFQKYNDAIQGSKEQHDSIIVMASASSKVMANLSKSLKDDLSVFLEINRNELTKIIQIIAPKSSPYSKIIPDVIGLAEVGTHILADGIESVLLSDPNIIANVAQNFVNYRNAEKGSEKRRKYLAAAVVSSSEVIGNLNPLVINELANYLKANKAELAEVTSKLLPAAKPFTHLIPYALDLAANLMPQALSSTVSLLSKADGLSKLADDFSKYQLHTKLLATKDLRLEVEIDLRKSQKDFFDKIIDQSVNLLKSPEVKRVLQHDIPQILNNSRDEISELAIQATKNPEIYKLGIPISDELIKASITLFTELTSDILSQTPDLAGITKEVGELVKAPKNEHKQKAESIAGSILKLKKDDSDKTILGNLVETKLPKFIEAHFEELEKIINQTLEKTKFGKVVKNRGKQIIDVFGKKLPEAEKLVEGYIKGERAALIPKALKFICNKEMLSLIVGIAGDAIKHKLWGEKEKEDKKSFNTDIQTAQNETASKLSVEGQKDLGAAIAQLALSGAVTDQTIYVNSTPVNIQVKGDAQKKGK